jgi:hypothetical protein
MQFSLFLKPFKCLPYFVPVHVTYQATFLYTENNIGAPSPEGHSLCTHYFLPNLFISSLFLGRFHGNAEAKVHTFFMLLLQSLSNGEFI